MGLRSLSFLVKALFKCCFVLVMVFQFYSCKPKPQQYSIDLTQLTPTSVFDIFSNIELVRLENTPENLIGNIGKVIYHDGFYFIWDSQAQAILGFCDGGSFVFKISAIGRGPGEYSNITDFSIDRENGRLLILDAPMQRVLFYDLKGQHLFDLSIFTGQVMALNRVFPVSDTVILLTSITNQQLLFYSINENRVLHSDFLMDVYLQAFKPLNNVYQFNGRTFVLPAMSQQILDVTDMEPNQHFQWCFGRHNNSDDQKEKLLYEIKRRVNPFDFFRFPHEAVGAGKFLHQHILEIFETPRFMIALVEFDYNWRHVFMDKHSGEIRVFNHFEEQVSLSFVSVQEDRIIAYDSGVADRIRAMGVEEIQQRIVDGFNPAILSESDRQIIENHDPMTQNPFLVVYRFRE